MQSKCYYCDTLLVSGLCPDKCKQPSASKLVSESTPKTIIPKEQQSAKQPTIATRNSLLPPGQGHLRLPDGSIVSLQDDWREKSYYSTLVIEPGKPQWEAVHLFSYGLSQLVSGTTRCATQIHTNIPRSGDCGLPMDYRGLVFGWRAVTDLDTPEFRHWAMNVHCVFKYNCRSYMESSLYELLRKPGFYDLDESVFTEFESPRDPPFAIPVVLNSNLAYSVIVTALDSKATTNLFNTIEQESLIRFHLDGLWHVPLI